MIGENSGVFEIRGEAGVVFGEPIVLKPAILLHSCCGPCSSSVVEQLAQRFRITLFFCNSNIDDEEEYKKRLAAQKEFVERYNTSDRMGEAIELVCAPYKPAAFLELVRGLEDSAEGGERCRLCIRDRIEKTADYAALHGFEYFSTTLSVSRHKNHKLICETGNELALRYGLSFIADDFKKCGGEQRSAELAKAYDLYRQNYCGCSFSKR